LHLFTLRLTPVLPLFHINLARSLTLPGEDRALGVTLIGKQAGDLLPEYVLAMKHGIGLNGVLATIHIDPTLAEDDKHAAGMWRHAHAPQGLLGAVERFHAGRRR
jgi:hypothetical protein